MKTLITSLGESDDPRGESGPMPLPHPWAGPRRKRRKSLRLNFCFLKGQGSATYRGAVAIYMAAS